MGNVFCNNMEEGDLLEKPDAIMMLWSLLCNSLIIFLCHKLWLTSETVLITLIPLGAWQMHCKYLSLLETGSDNISPKGNINSDEHNTQFSHYTLFFLQCEWWFRVAVCHWWYWYGKCAIRIILQRHFHNQSHNCCCSRTVNYVQLPWHDFWAMILNVECRSTWSNVNTLNAFMKSITAGYREMSKRMKNQWHYMNATVVQIKWFEHIQCDSSEWGIRRLSQVFQIQSHVDSYCIPNNIGKPYSLLS